MKIEFFATSDGRQIIANSNNSFNIIEPGNPIINSVDKLIKDTFPKCHERLCKKYGSCKYSRMLRFAKCNWSVNDNIPDIDGKMINVEFVPCPLRGECTDENVICNPQLETGLSVRETEITILIANGYTDGEIASRLFLSEKTVETHRNNILKKLSLHSKSQITAFAYQNKLIL